MMNSGAQEYKITMNGHLCLGDEKILRLKQLPSLGIGLITEVLIQLVTLSRVSDVKLTMIG